MKSNHKRIQGYIGIAIITLLFAVMAKPDCHAQASTQLQNNLNTYYQNSSQEKIYVHTSKSFFLTGEILWFKIYNTDVSTNKLLDISKVAYAELIDNTHNAVLQTKVAMVNGMGNGSFYIPFSLNNGNYQLRVYTNWMKNFGADHFFEKVITIVNPLKTPNTNETNPAAATYDVQFFPEGGHLVKGLASKIAFKIIGNDGKGIDGTGAIVAGPNDTLIRFKSLKFGMGSFMFTPSSVRGYKAVIRTNNQQITRELPEISESGYVMQATDKGNDWDIAIQNNKSNATSGIYLIAHSKHTIKLAQSINIANGSAHLSIDKNKLSEGINYITLFDEQQKPICERLIFKRPARKLFISSATDNKTYGTRKKIDLAISSSDASNKPLPAYLSVSVYKTDALQNDEANHIAASLWLGDLKGHIESADYYLDTNTAEANQAADNLMLSQGWTQFDWNKTQADNGAHLSFLPEYTGQFINGIITENASKSPAKNIAAYLTIPGTRKQLFTTKSDSLGRLLFNVQDFYGSSEMVVQPNPLVDSTYHIEIASPFYNQFSNSAIPVFNLSTEVKKELVDNSLNMQVQNIFMLNQLKQFYAPEIDTAAFYGKPAKTYKLDDYTRFTTIEEVLREYVTSIAVSKRQGKFNIKVFNDITPLDGQPMVLIDGLPLFDVDKLFAVNPLKLKKLDMVTTNYVYGPSLFNGIMSFTTYKNDANSFAIDPHAVVIDYEGLQLERKFYSPVYGTDQQSNSTIPDFRNTLYWNPDANTNLQGKNNLSFYTGDKPGHYVGIIEGITDNGETGYQRFSFEVKK